MFLSGIQALCDLRFYKFFEAHIVEETAGGCKSKLACQPPKKRVLNVTP
jgi:hypothetical protein